MNINQVLAPSEFILNDDGSIYHLNLKPGDIATTIITVGDPNRVNEVAKHFDHIEVEVEKREFKTVTGTYKGKRLSVISTGIGTDNIDIVFNELDALVNIDFETRTVKSEHTRLSFIRIGTSGAIQPNIAVDSFVVAKTAIGFDSLLYFYEKINFLDTEFSEVLKEHLNWYSKKSDPYVVSASEALLQRFSAEIYIKGITVTNVGFYGPQGRQLRLDVQDQQLNHKLQTFTYNNRTITNLEMETSGIYGMAKLLGHEAISLNAILANRPNKTFSSNPKKAVATLIENTLDILAV